MTKTDLTAAIEAITRAKTPEELEALRVKYLGRRGVLTLELRAVGQVSGTDARKAAGEAANLARHEIEAALAKAGPRLMQNLVEVVGQAAQVDLTAPVPSPLGHLHPVSQLLRELVQIFWQMGYEVADGPEVETPWYNFEALNIPADHPARDMQDTFYLEGSELLPRTHTSGVQIRYMEAHQPPIRIIVPGKVYRNEDEDARHSWMFYQVEGLVVDEGISMADLKGTLLAMMRGLLGYDTKVRLRPSYFPYTEPSAEMDATCIICGGTGKDCKTCSGTGWLELGGAGMVHPQVLRNCHIDPVKYSGFAFGFGPERIAAIKYGVPDVREFWRPNLKFLEQF